MIRYGDLLEPLYELARQDKGITFIQSREIEEYVSYKDILIRSQYLCRYLKEQGVEEGNEVAIQCSNLKNYVYTFWACVIGGYIAVPIDTGNRAYKTQVNDKIFSILKNPFLIYDEYGKEADVFGERCLNLTDFDFHIEQLGSAEVHDKPKEGIVYVQFSSGSTGKPKGAMLKHSNILANVYDIIERLEMTSEDISLSWQPLTHCYGFIVFHIVPIVLGISHYLMSSELFMQYPLLWIEKASELHATRLGTIPFAMKHVLEIHRRTEEKKNWDLSAVKSITVGGELVTSELCREFIQDLQKYHLCENTMIPIYGLAESTTCLSLLSLNAPLISHKISRESLEIAKKVVFAEKKEENGMSYLEQGKPLHSLEIKITDENGIGLSEDTIGHIWAKGDNIACGYYNDEESTKDAFLEDGWLDTGDLGFFHQGNVIVVGREKELIVVNGMKYMSVDIENIIKQKVSQCNNCELAVCNGIDTENGSEQAIVFIVTEKLADQQVIEQFQKLSSKIKEIVYQITGLMVEHIIPIDNLPKTFSGKIKRKELTNRYNAGEFKESIKEINVQVKEKEIKVEYENMTKEKIQSKIVEVIKDLFQIRVDDMEQAFKSFGIVSINIPPFVEQLNKIFQTKLQVSTLFSNPNINQLSNYIYKSIHQSKVRKGDMVMGYTVEENDGIAIIGMSCRFPGGANDVWQYWKVLMNGIDGIIDVPEDRWDWEKYYSEDDNAPGKMYCKKGGFLQTPIDEFDAKFFNISPKEAQSLDPQQRLMLELTWEAFEYADLDITKYKGSETGVFLGMSTTEYMLSNIYSGDLTTIDAYSLTGTCMSTACGRISYTFGFEGPCITVDTACSSSLSALHLACQAIRSGETNTCVVGGVNMMDSPAINVGFSKLRATAKDGHSKAFDESANGYGRSEGGGVILIKRLADAERDGDVILGVIRGTGINQDGKSNGLTAPNGESQTKLIKNTLHTAGLAPEDIDYVEMHGTGTKLGDPIEVNAIVDTFGGVKTKEHPLMIGSVKSNIGHLEAGSGIASIIKVLLSMKNHVIPANLNFNKPNPFIDWANSPVKVISEHTPWNKEGIRRAGVSAFGFGGSNAHVIIEEYKQDEPVSKPESEGLDYILKISAKTEKSLNQSVEKYAEFLKEHKEIPFSDFVYSADRGRTDFEYRMCITGATRESILEGLELYKNGEVAPNVFTNFVEKRSYQKNRKVVFMFTGQGSQYVNMGKMLYETSDAFRDSMDKCAKLFKPFLLKSIVDLLYGEKADADVIQKTVYAQPLIFSIEYALAQLLMSCGVQPEMVMGHSIGEYAAAVVAGIISLENAVQLVSIRGRLMDSAPGSGSMGTIFASEEQVIDMIKPYYDIVDIAAHNAADTCVISGDTTAVHEILDAAEAKGIRVSRLKVSHGFHSVLMEPVLDDYAEIAKECTYQPAKVKFISSLYAKEIGEDQILDDNYWTEHIRAKVDFYGAITSIQDISDYLLLEVGPHTVLSALCKLIFGDDATITGTLNRKVEDAKQFSQALSILYCAGVDVDWSKIHFRGINEWRKTELPLYSYDKLKYWMELIYDRKSAGIDVGEGVHRFLGQKIESPVFEDSIVFQNKYTNKNPFFMSEHIIFDTSIAPAASYVSMLISSVKDIKNPSSVTFKHIDLREPLALSEEDERIVQVCISNAEEKEAKFNIVSKAIGAGSKEWATHTQGLVSVSSEYKELDNALDPTELANTEFNFDPEKGIYNSMHNAGFDLGDSFRRITKSYVKDRKAICYVEPMENVPESDMYILYPGVIDSIFQSMLCVVFEQFDEEEEQRNGKNTTIPYYFDSITYNYRDSKNLWCVVDAGMDQDIISGDIDIVNEKGETVMMIRGFMTKLTNRENLLRGLKSTNKGMYYHIIWEKKDSLVKNDAINSMKYLLITDDATVNTILCEQYQKENLQCSSIMLEETCQERESTLFADTIQKMIEKADQKMAILYAVKNDCTKRLLNLVQTVADMGAESKCLLKILTMDVQSFDEEKAINLAQAPVWGMAKTIGIEYPNLYAGIVDVDSEILNNSPDLIVKECIQKSEKEVALRKREGRMVSRLIKNTELPKYTKEKGEPIEIHEDASYLITGGTGALGQIYAECLVEKGAKTILLMSRSGANEAVQAMIDAYKDKGVTVEVVKADVCDLDNLKAAIASVKENFPTIKGVVHAAGTLRDKMISDQTWDDYRAVLDPKVTGSRNLYDVLDVEELDFFFMLSSITSIIGNVGQSNYAAANYFMNRFAYQMQNNGVNGYTFCWGPWEGNGMASNDATSKNMDGMGLASITKETGAQVISEFFEQPYTNLVVVDMNWNKYIDTLSNNGNKNYLSKVVENKESNATKQDDSSVLKELKALSKDERIAYLEKKLQNTCGKIMGYSNGQQMDMEETFNEQGVDSLMIFSMRNAINKMLKLELNVSTFFNYPSIRKLTDYLINEEIFLEEEERVENESTEDFLSELANLTE